MAFLASRDEHTMTVSARVILGFLQNFTLHSRPCLARKRTVVHSTRFAAFFGAWMRLYIPLSNLRGWGSGQCVQIFSDKRKHVIQTHAQFNDRAVRTTRIARSHSPTYMWVIIICFCVVLSCDCVGLCDLKLCRWHGTSPSGWWEWSSWRSCWDLPPGTVGHCLWLLVGYHWFSSECYKDSTYERKRITITTSISEIPTNWIQILKLFLCTHQMGTPEASLRTWAVVSYNVTCVCVC